jgi:hypothetical protein
MEEAGAGLWAAGEEIPRLMPLSKALSVSAAATLSAALPDSSALAAICRLSSALGKDGAWYSLPNAAVRIDIGEFSSSGKWYTGREARFLERTFGVCSRMLLDAGLDGAA